MYLQETKSVVELSFFFPIQSISNSHGWFVVGVSHCYYFAHKENFACILCFLATPQVPLSPCVKIDFERVNMNHHKPTISSSHNYI